MTLFYHDKFDVCHCLAYEIKILQVIAQETNLFTEDFKSHDSFMSKLINTYEFD